MPYTMQTQHTYYQTYKMMKKILPLVMLIGIASHLFAIHIEKKFNFNNIKCSQQGEYSLLHIAGSMNTALAGQPALPWFAAKILLPHGEEVQQYHFKGKHLTPVPGHFRLAPMQHAQPISQGAQGTTFIDTKCYASDAPYPAANYRSGGTHFWSGYSIGFVYYTPFVYHPQSGRLYYYQEVEIEVRTKATNKAKTATQLLSYNSTIAQLIQDKYYNAEALDSYPSPQKTTTSNQFELLIVSPEAFADSFQGLQTLYLHQGLRSKFVSTETIAATSNGIDLPEKIRNYCKQAYANHGLQYLLLGGDIEHVPYRGFYCHVQSSSVYESSNIPSDLYFSALDGNWNNDSDDKWGEIGEDDLLPEIAVARLPFSTTEELNNMLNKTISYQNAPVQDMLNHPMMAGEKLWDNPITYGSDFLELLIGHREDNGYTTDGIPEGNPITQIFDKNTTWNKAKLMQEVNNGKSFLHHSGHANYNTVMKLDIEDITDANFSGADGTNHMFTNIYTHGCICGSFDAEDCIAEHMLKIQNFAASFVGNSRYGWFNEGQTEGPSAHLHREYINALYHDKIFRIGATHAASKTQTATWVNAPGQHEEGALRWCFYDCNVLGDPAMSLWTEKPEAALNITHDNEIAIGQETFDIQALIGDGTPLTNASFQLIKDGQLHGQAYTNAQGEATITLSSLFNELGTAELWIFAHNQLMEMRPINIVAAEGIYLHTQNLQLVDENNLPEPGDDMAIHIDIKNEGNAVANNTHVQLTCDSPYITILQGEADCGNINASSTYALNDVLTFHIAGNIPNNAYYTLAFQLSCNNSSQTWTSYIEIPSYAPDLHIASLVVDDATGNNNGRLDPGESATLRFNIANKGGCQSQSGQALLSHISHINISHTSSVLEPIAGQATSSISFAAEVPSSTAVGDSVQFKLSLKHGEYHTSAIYKLCVGLAIEDWEDNNFDAYEWIMDATHPWIIANTTVYEGSYAAHSANINDKESSSLGLGFEALANDSISFYGKVSSEFNYDFLYFYINGKMTERWSGEQDWARHAYPLSKGYNNIKWTYKKDITTAQGNDKAYIDYIVLPQMGSFEGVDKNLTGNNLHFYPNPVQHTATLTFWQKETGIVSYAIYSTQGQLIRRATLSALQGNNQHSIDIKNLLQGSYIIILQDNKKTIGRIPFIKL